MKTLTRLSVGLLILTAACTQPKETELRLGDLDLSGTAQGWGGVMTDKSVTGKELSIAGTKYAYGVGTHSISRIKLALDRASVRFQALVGVDDQALDQPGSVEFSVVGDGKTLWKSPVMKPGDKALPVDIPISRVKVLELVAGDAGDGINYDHANWAEARFTGNTARIRADKPLIEEAVILTPKPGPKPRINGTKLFGVRPGSPFLFKIAATGTKPLRYEVINLPDGLKVDPSTGMITGSISPEGTWETTIRVTNEAGTAERPFRIVCGPTLGLTPQMGWNSWYIWENHVTDRIMREAADAMVSTGMIDHGYQYVNIDDCWSVKPSSDNPELNGEPRDSAGNIRLNRRFPDMYSLTDYIHSKGLKAGTYTSPGPFTCAGHVAAYGFEEQDVRQYVDWGFDFLKYDWCSYGNLADERNLDELQKPYLLISSILARQPRDIILNLCQYGMGDVWKWGRRVGGNSWRTAGDLGGSFNGIGTALFRDGFDVYSQDSLHLYAGPGGWNDPDYLLFGYLSNWSGQTVPTPLSPNEQYTQMSLWALVAAPLIFSGDMTRLDEFTLNVLTNDEIIEVDQDPLGKPGYRVFRQGETEVWKRELEDGAIAVGLFNRGEGTVSVTATWSALGISGTWKVRDLWRQKDLGRNRLQVRQQVGRHGAAMLKLTPVIN